MTRYYERYENGELVESVEVPYTQEEILSALVKLRDYRAEHYPYKGIVLRLGNEKAMVSLSTLYLLCLASPAIPDEQVMADWQEEEGDVQITAGDLRNDGAVILGNYQKAWSVFKALKSEMFDTIEELETAFNTAMEE